MLVTPGQPDYIYSSQIWICVAWAFRLTVFTDLYPRLRYLRYKTYNWPTKLTCLNTWDKRPAIGWFAQGTSQGTGAGYGSAGGHATGTSTVLTGGSAYGSTRHVTEPGSGGGSSALGRGGNGGGLLNLTVNRMLLLEGECCCTLSSEWHVSVAKPLKWGRGCLQDVPSPVWNLWATVWPPASLSCLLSCSWFKLEFIQRQNKDTVNSYRLINKLAAYRRWAHFHIVERKRKNTNIYGILVLLSSPVFIF